MTFEQVLLFAIFLLVPILNWVRRRMRGGAPQEPGAEEQRRLPAPPSVPVPAPPPAPPRARVIAPRPRQDPVWTPPAAPVVAMPAPSHSPARARIRLRGQSDVRRAVVLMAVLGPCRANEPSSPPGL